MLDLCFFPGQMLKIPPTDWINMIIRVYLQYRKCCVFHFVIQLLSEPDKQKYVAGLFKRQLM